MAKRFFYVSAAILCLALSYHFGARSATAQAPSDPVVALNNGGWAVTASGEVYGNVDGSGAIWQRRGNVFGGAAPANQESFGGVKARYR